MRKLIPVLIVAALLLSLLAACTTTPQSVTPTPSTDVGDAQTPSPTEQGEGAKTPEYIEPTVQTENHEYYDKTYDQASDDKMLRNYREANIEHSFEDDKVVAFFRYDFEGEIGLSYFDKLGDLGKVVALKYKTTVIEDETSTITLTAGTYHTIILTLATHDKSIVLSAAKEIMSWDDVVITEPMYIYRFAWDDVNDPYFTNQASLQPSTDINIQNDRNIILHRPDAI